MKTCLKLKWKGETKKMKNNNSQRCGGKGMGRVDVKKAREEEVM